MRTVIKNTIKPVVSYLFSPRYREFYRLHDRYRAIPRFTTMNVRFLEYSVVVADCASFLGQYKDIFVDEVYQFKSGETEPVILDCGANIGMSCIYFKTLFPSSRIRAYEADCRIAGILKSNLERNAMTNIEIVAKAIWIHDKGVLFGVQGADGGSIFRPENAMSVASIRLRDEIEKEESIDLLKMDIEGAETDVLTDCRDVLHRVKRTFIEYHSWERDMQRLDEILDILKESGFRYYIESYAHTPTPFIAGNLSGAMDLKLNIWGIRR
jgi:FkbM family methyltransferase